MPAPATGTTARCSIRRRPTNAGLQHRPADQVECAYTVDAGHFQYEGDLFICGYNNTSTPDTNTTAWTVGNPTFKLGLLNNVDFEVNFSFYNSVRATQVSTGASAIAQGVGDTSCASSGTSLVTMTTGRRWR
jgi:hypothetical protein